MKEKKKGKAGRPLGKKIKTGASPGSWHPSEAKSEVAKGRIRDERGYFLGKRQLRFDLNYVPEEQKYYIIAVSGDSQIDVKDNCSGVDGVKARFDRILRNWRGNLQ